MAIENEVQLVYDKQCPVCEFYCQRVDIRESAGTLLRVDARDASELMDEITALGLDIDEGMVVKTGDQIYYGSDAINALALLSSRSGVINRCAYYLFRSQRSSRMLYPVLRSCRNLLLKMLGRTRINNLRLSGRDRF